MWTEPMAEHHPAACTDNHGYKVSLELRKLYEVLPEKHSQQRAA